MIRRSRLAQNLIKLQILYNCVIKFLIGNFHVPSAANYITDLITIILLFLMISESRGKVGNNALVIFFGLFFLTTIVSFAVNMYNPMLYIWGARNIFRFYIFFFACTHFMRVETCHEIFCILKKIFWINFVLICIQKWVLHYIGDGCSGLYSSGNMSGGNGSVNILMCVVMAYILSEYMTKKNSLKQLITYFAATLAIAAFIELKVYFIEVIVLFILLVGSQNFSEKTLIVVVALIALLVLGIDAFERIYPSFKDFFSINGIVEDSLIYGSTEKIGRLSGMGIVMEKYLPTISQKLFGIGLGNADFSSSFSFITSVFYMQHQSTGYYYFISAWMLLETGIVGTILYLAPILYAFITSWKFRADKNQTVYMALFFSAIIALQFFYNQMLRVETSGYLMQLALSVIFIYKKERVN